MTNKPLLCARQRERGPIRFVSRLGARVTNPMLFKTVLVFSLMQSIACGREVPSGSAFLHKGRQSADAAIKRSAVQEPLSAKADNASRGFAVEQDDWTGEPDKAPIVTRADLQPGIDELKRDSAELYFDYPLDSKGKVVDAKNLRLADVEGFSSEDFRQGDLGNCTFVAALSAISSADASYLRYVVGLARDSQGYPLIDDQGYPLFRARFNYAINGNDRAEWEYLLDTKLPTMESKNLPERRQPFLPPRETNDGRVLIGGALLEKAFARFLQDTNYFEVLYGKATTPSKGRGYIDVDEGAWPEDVFAVLTGTSGKIIKDNVEAAKVLETVKPGDGVAVVADLTYEDELPPSKLVSGASISVHEATDKSRAGGSKEFEYISSDAGSRFKLRDVHAYSILGTDRGVVNLRNSWGMTPHQRGYQPGYGVFAIPTDDVSDLFSAITVVDLTP